MRLLCRSRQNKKYRWFSCSTVRSSSSLLWNQSVNGSVWKWIKLPGFRPKTIKKWCFFSIVKDALFQASKPKCKPIIEWFMPPIYGDLGDSLWIKLFFTHINEYQQHVSIVISILEHFQTQRSSSVRSWKRCHCCRVTRLDENQHGPGGDEFAKKMRGFSR